MEEYELYGYQDELIFYNEQDKTGLLLSNGMDENFSSYTGDGSLKMDKKLEKCFSKGNQELVIESAFIGEITVKDILKGYLLERQSNGINLSTQKSLCYNNNKNIIVATPPKEVC